MPEKTEHVRQNLSRDEARNFKQGLTHRTINRAMCQTQDAETKQETIKEVGESGIIFSLVPEWLNLWEEEQ